jgi:hypothetical protein
LPLKITPQSFDLYKLLAIRADNNHIAFVDDRKFLRKMLLNLAGTVFALFVSRIEWWVASATRNNFFNDQK